MLHFGYFLHLITPNLENKLPLWNAHCAFWQKAFDYLLKTLLRKKNFSVVHNTASFYSKCQKFCYLLNTKRLNSSFKIPNIIQPNLQTVTNQSNVRKLPTNLHISAWAVAKKKYKFSYNNLVRWPARFFFRNFEVLLHYFILF